MIKIALLSSKEGNLIEYSCYFNKNKHSNRKKAKK